LGGIGSAFLLYGIAFIYGASGHLSFPTSFQVGWNFSTLGISLILFGFLFKVGAFPFQSWVPDIYSAAPTPLTGFMATAVKVAAFVAFLRFILPLDTLASLRSLLPLLAMATMFIGNLMALGNKSPKTTLAYSSVAHTGYLLIGFAVGSSALPAILMYLAAYTLMTLGAFAVLSTVPENEGRHLQGLLQRRPLIALGFAICILSLAGMPPLLGFHGKLTLFLAAWARPELHTLVIVAVFNSLIALGYYIPLLRWALFAKPREEEDQSQRSFRLNLACAFCVICVILFGLFPQALFHYFSQLSY
jgi:NADH-quinone oxidoreductase subunit N